MGDTETVTEETVTKSSTLTDAEIIGEHAEVDNECNTGPDHRPKKLTAEWSIKEKEHMTKDRMKDDSSIHDNHMEHLNNCPRDSISKMEGKRDGQNVDKTYKKHKKRKKKRNNIEHSGKSDTLNENGDLNKSKEYSGDSEMHNGTEVTHGTALCQGGYSLDVRRDSDFIEIVKSANYVNTTDINSPLENVAQNLSLPHSETKKRKKLKRRKRRERSNHSDSDEATEKVRQKRRKKKMRHKDKSGGVSDGELDKERGERRKMIAKQTRDASLLSDITVGKMVLNAEHMDQGHSINTHNQSQNLNSQLLGRLNEKTAKIGPEGDSKSKLDRVQNNHNADSRSKSRVDIFTVGAGVVPTSPKTSTFTFPNPQNEQVQKPQRKKKKLHGLKKTRATVGIDPSLTALPETPDSTSIKSEPVSTDGDHGKLINDKCRGSPKPLLLCRIIAGYPVLSFVIVTIVHLAVFAVTGGLMATGYDVFPVVFDKLPLYIYDDYHLKDLSWKSKNRFSGYVGRPVYSPYIATGLRSQIKDTVEVIFETPGANLLTKQYLDWVQLSEDRLFNVPMYKEEYCKLDHLSNCVKPYSILRFFDGSLSHIDPVFNDPNFTNIHEVIFKAHTHNDTRDYLHMFLGKHSIITANYSVTDITRTVFLMGWPLGTVKLGDKYVLGTLEVLTDFEAKVFRAEIEYIRDMLLVDLIDVYYISKLLYEYDLIQQAMKDIMLAIGSVVFIFVFMCIQTGTLVVTFLGVLSIVSSYLLTNLIYRYVFQFIYFGFFHVIALFLILGIGADDLFVFYDTWRLSGDTNYPSLAHRLSDCYRRAAKTTFVTSITTMMAFLVSGLSPLLPVQTFGIFCGVLVAINYILVIIYFPTVIMIHHTKVKHIWKKFHKFLLSCCSSVQSSKTFTSNTSDTNSIKSLIQSNSDGYTQNHVEKNNKETVPGGPGGEFVQVHPESSLDKIKINPSPQQKGEVRLDLMASEADVIRQVLAEKRKKKAARAFQDRNRVVRFLRNTFFRVMTSRVVRIVVPFVILGLSIFFIHRATLVEPYTQQLRLFRDDHNYAKASVRHYTRFMRNNEDEYTRVYLVWGLLPADISQCNTKSATYCHGIPQYDEEFDMNTPEAQIAVKDLCAYLDTLSEATVDSLHIRRDTSSGRPQIACFTKPMETFFQQEIDDRNTNSFQSYPSDLSLDLPVTPGNVTTFMNYNSQIYTRSMPSDFKNHFEILIAHWMTNKFTLSPTPDYLQFKDLLGEKTTQYSRGAYYSSSSLLYGTKLQYMAIEINTTLNVYQLSYKTGLPIYKRWEELMHTINQRLPHPINKGMQLAEVLWHWLHIQETLANAAISGILVGLLSAWPILVLTTFNVIIGTLATITIGLVTACVVGLIPLVGWKIGVLESINLCMVVGLSVDYVVHLAEAYRMSESDKRMDRVQGMLESIGLSVVSGAITTMGAAVFMLFAQIQFFYQFGIFIISTVGISLVFSLFGYTSFMSFCGPEGEFGNLKHIAVSIKKFCQRKPDETTGKRGSCCVCASPSVVLDRIYDHMSYGTHRPV